MKEQTSHYCLRQNFSGQLRGRIKDSAPLSSADGAPRRPFAKVGRALRLGVLDEHTGSGPSEASRLPSSHLYFQPLIRISLQPPPPEPSREPGWDRRKLECRARGREG